MIYLKKEVTTIKYKLCLNWGVIKIYKFLQSVKNITNYQRKRYELMEISIKPNNFLDVPNIYQDEASMDMILDEFKCLTSTCWDKQYQPLTIDMTKDKYTGRYRLGPNSLLVPNSSPF